MPFVLFLVMEIQLPSGLLNINSFFSFIILIAGDWESLLLLFFIKKQGNSFLSKLIALIFALN